MTYSADNIETLRFYTAILIDPCRESWDAAFLKEHSAMIEDRVRTYVAAKVSVQDLAEEVRKAMVAYYETKGVFYDKEGRLIQNAASA